MKRRTTSNARSRATRTTAPYLDSIGWLHYRQGKYEQALAELLNAAQDSKTDDPTVFEHIGDTYAMLNQDAQGARILAEGARARPDEQKAGGEDRRS